MANSMSYISQACTPDVADKVAYEMRMFRHVYDKLVQLEVDMHSISLGAVMPRVGTGISTEEVRDASALLESFLLHARVLRDSFCRGRQKPDDVVAGDFVSGWTTPLPADYVYVSQQSDRLNKALAHLSTTRVKYDSEGKEWDVVTIRREIMSMIDRFLAKLPDDRRHWFEEA